jgi:hypothetical protein
VRSLLQCLGAALACAVCACVPTSALAAARSSNTTATRAYLRIVVEQQRVENSDVGMGVAAVQVFARQIAGECPGALAYAPRDVAYEQIGGEFEYALSIAVDDALVPQAKALGLARALDALHWSNRRLTRLVRDREAEERAYATGTPPNLCAQIAAWRESAYAALPESSIRFLAEMGASEPAIFVGPREEPRAKVIARLLESYQKPAERRLTKIVLAFEIRIHNRLAATINSAEKQLATALGVAEL